MTDVLRIALDRRDQLHEEIQRLDDFIRTAEELIRGSKAATPRSVTDDSEQSGPARMNLLRRGQQAAVG